MKEKILSIDSSEMLSSIFGHYDTNLTLIEERFGVRIYNRDNNIVLSGEEGDNLENAYATLYYLRKLAILGEPIDEQKTEYAMNMFAEGHGEELASVDRDLILITPKGKPIKAKTVGQKQYVDKIRSNTVVLGIGPAGTGKTFLAVAMAVAALREKKVSRIILTRPAVEAGERLGYLPGDLQSKIDPYLRPLYDALYETMGMEGYQRNVEKGVIEIAPLAYMRGRTLDDSFIILDEAQNTTPEQMKMFLTRLGFGSKAVVTGDLTQTDLPRSVRSGLAEAVKVLEGIDDIAIHSFTERDVVRHRLVQKIIQAYDKYERTRAERSTDRSSTRKYTGKIIRKQSHENTNLSDQRSGQSATGSKGSKSH
ncbi:MAG: PhoH family protein [Eubacteriales bacterium]